VSVWKTMWIAVVCASTLPLLSCSEKDGAGDADLSARPGGTEVAAGEVWRGDVLGESPCVPQCGSGMGWADCDDVVSCGQPCLCAEGFQCRESDGGQSVCFSPELQCPDICSMGEWAPDGGAECGPVWNGLGDDTSCDCGTCDGTQEICAENKCVCQPDCTDKQCGDDGCGGSCGQCDYEDDCSDEGTCICVPDCGVLDGPIPDCGSDGCGGYCECPEVDDLCLEKDYDPDEAGEPDGFCWNPVKWCPEVCDKVECGEYLAVIDANGQGTCNCGECPEGQVCVDGPGGYNICCLPDCAAKNCGDDGCGGDCGECYDGDPCTDDSCLDGTCQPTTSPDDVPCGESDEPWAEDFQHCLQGICCHPNVNWCWDGICDCDGWPMYGTCESECDSLNDDTDWGAMCVWQCGGDCCNVGADCPAEKPQCAKLPTLKFEGMWPVGRCVEEAAYPACWWKGQCEVGELCIGAPTADECPHCNVSCPGLVPGSCAPDNICGNGLVEFDLGETCDDGNTVGGDGCDEACHTECVPFCLDECGDDGCGGSCAEPIPQGCDEGLPEQECEAAGGYFWYPGCVGIGCICGCPTGDAGCPCIDGLQCQGLCVTEYDHNGGVPFPCEDKLTGTCAPYEPHLGCLCTLTEAGLLSFGCWD
jgi:hypothetical protein